jgi:4-amino-4-deoxy-L-arabinose transferase-like glycosyltransferase
VDLRDRAVDMGTRATCLAILSLLITALAIRAGAATVWHQRLAARGQLWAFGDSDSYWVLASALARGQPYEYGGPEARVFRVPGYPLLLAPFTLIENRPLGVLAARWAGAVLGAIAVGLVLRIAWELGGRSAGWLAGIWAAVDPSAVASSVLLLSEALFVPVMLLQLWSWMRCESDLQSRWASRWALGSGACGAIAVLTRPSWVLFLPAMLCCWNAWRAGHRDRRLRLSGLMVVGFVLLMLPWWYRNFQITHRFVPTTLTVGASLYDGLSPIASGASDTGMEFMARFQAEQLAADAAATEPLASTLEYRLDRRMARAAASWAISHPAQVARLAGIKIWRTWRPWPEAAELPGGILRWSVALSTLFVLGSAGWRVYQRAGDGWVNVLWITPAIYFTLIHAVFVGSLRYRLPAMIALIPLAACAWTVWIQSARGTAYR